MFLFLFTFFAIISVAWIVFNFISLIWEVFWDIISMFFDL